LLFLQKLSLLVTEAYKDAHQKSVKVRERERLLVKNLVIAITFLGPAIIQFFHIFSGNEGENEQSCPELRNATRPQ
jgi:hypothetical protein